PLPVLAARSIVTTPSLRSNRPRYVEVPKCLTSHAVQVWVGSSLYVTGWARATAPAPASRTSTKPFARRSMSKPLSGHLAQADSQRHAQQQPILVDEMVLQRRRHMQADQRCQRPGQRRVHVDQHIGERLVLRRKI